MALASLGSAPADQAADLAVERAVLTLLAALLVAVGLPIAHLELQSVATPEGDPAGTS